MEPFLALKEPERDPEWELGASSVSIASVKDSLEYSHSGP